MLLSGHGKMCQISPVLLQVMAERPSRYRSSSKVIVHDTPSHASDHFVVQGVLLCQ